MAPAGYYLAASGATPALTTGVATAYAWTISTGISLGIIYGTKQEIDFYREKQRDREIVRRQKEELRLRQEFRREIIENEVMEVEDKYSFYLRVHKNRSVKIVIKFISNSKKKIVKKLQAKQNKIRLVTKTIVTNLKKRAFSAFKGLCNIVKRVQFKGTGDLLSNWSFETHNHIDHVNLYSHINPSLIGFNTSNNNPVAKNNNKPIN